MLISYKWLQEILGADPGVDAVTSALGRGGLEVDRVTHVGAALRSVVLASVVATRPHPAGKKGLTVVRVDAGEREVEVACGAPVIPAAPALVCYAPVGAQVLDRNGALVTLTEKAVAGFTSPGMLCAEDELGLGSSHEGLLTVEGGRPGQSLLDWEPRLEDWIIELSVTPNRPDALGHLGVARDVAAVLGLPFRPPAVAAARANGAGAPAAVQTHAVVEVRDGDRCPRYDGQVIEGVGVGPSPLWTRVRLGRLGVRPITNIVDATNLVMLERGQPLHAFDLDTLRLPIEIRRAKPGEAFVALDGQKLSLDEDDLVIADADRVVALAGVIGGADSGVTATTRRVFLESAYFEPRGIRRSARRYGFHTEASHRFEREVDLSGIWS